MHNPDFAKFATLCGAHGATVRGRDTLHSTLAAALDHDGPSLVEIASDVELV